MIETCAQARAAGEEFGKALATADRCQMNDQEESPLNAMAREGLARVLAMPADEQHAFLDGMSDASLKILDGQSYWDLDREELRIECAIRQERQIAYSRHGIARALGVIGLSGLFAPSSVVSKCELEPRLNTPRYLELKAFRDRVQSITDERRKLQMKTPGDRAPSINDERETLETASPQSFTGYKQRGGELDQHTHDAVMHCSLSSGDGAYATAFQLLNQAGHGLHDHATVDMAARVIATLSGDDRARHPLWLMTEAMLLLGRA